VLGRGPADLAAARHAAYQRVVIVRLVEAPGARIALTAVEGRILL
jgi:hypothetical protein